MESEIEQLLVILKGCLAEQRRATEYIFKMEGAIPVPGGNLMSSKLSLSITTKIAVFPFK